MTTGTLNDLVAFEEPSLEDTDGGIAQGEWTERFRRLVAIETMPGSEPVIQQMLTGVNPVRVRVRSGVDTRTVTNGWRIRHVLNGTYYNIRSVMPHPDREWINLLCETGVAVNG